MSGFVKTLAKTLWREIRRRYLEFLGLVVITTYTALTYGIWTTATEQLHTSERPYVSIGQPDGTLASFLPSVNGKVGVVLFFTNAGRSPALNFLVNAGLSGLPPRFGKGSIQERHLERFRDVGPMLGGLLSSTSSGPDIPGNSTYREYLDSKFLLTAGELKGLNDGKYPWFEIFGSFEFCDELGEYVCRRFNLRYSPPPIDAFVSGPMPMMDCFSLPAVPPPEPDSMQVLHRCEQPDERRAETEYADRNAGVVFPPAARRTATPNSTP